MAGKALTGDIGDQARARRPSTRSRSARPNERASRAGPRPVQADERHQGRRQSALTEFDLRALLEALHESRDQLHRHRRSCGGRSRLHPRNRGSRSRPGAQDRRIFNASPWSSTSSTPRCPLWTIGPSTPRRDAGVIRRGGNVTCQRDRCARRRTASARCAQLRPTCRDAVESELRGAGQICSLDDCAR